MKAKLRSLLGGLLAVLALPLGAQTLEATYLGINNGMVQLGGSSTHIATRALDYLNDLPGYRALPVMHLVSETRQDMIIAVPEPAAASLLAATLGLLALRRRRG